MPTTESMARDLKKVVTTPGRIYDLAAVAADARIDLNKLKGAASALVPYGFVFRSSSGHRGLTGVSLAAVLSRSRRGQEVVKESPPPVEDVTEKKKQEQEREGVPAADPAKGGKKKEKRRKQEQEREVVPAADPAEEEKKKKKKKKKQDDAAAAPAAADQEAQRQEDVFTGEIVVRAQFGKGLRSADKITFSPSTVDPLVDDLDDVSARVLKVNAGAGKAVEELETRVIKLLPGLKDDDEGRLRKVVELVAVGIARRFPCFLALPQSLPEGSDLSKEVVRLIETAKRVTFVVDGPKGSVMSPKCSLSLLLSTRTPDAAELKIAVVRTLRAALLPLARADIEAALKAATVALTSRRCSPLAGVDLMCAVASRPARSRLVAGLREHMERDESDIEGVKLLKARRRSKAVASVDDFKPSGSRKERSGLLLEVIQALSDRSGTDQELGKRRASSVAPDALSPVASKRAKLGHLPFETPPQSARLDPVPMEKTPPHTKPAVKPLPTPKGGAERYAVDLGRLGLLQGLFEDNDLKSELTELVSMYGNGEIVVGIKKTVLREVEQILNVAGRDWKQLLQPKARLWAAMRDNVNIAATERLGLDVSLLPSAGWLRSNPDEDLERLRAHLITFDGGKRGCSVYASKVYLLEELLATPSTRAFIIQGMKDRIARTEKARCPRNVQRTHLPSGASWQS